MLSTETFNVLSLLLSIAAYVVLDAGPAAALSVALASIVTFPVMWAVL